MKIQQHLKFENLHFFRSKFKVFALFLFVVASIYGLHSGYALFQMQNDEVSEIEQKNKEKADEVIEWFNTGNNGPSDKPWIDVRVPSWAAMNAPVSVIKKPSGLMPFNTGQSEQYGYYKQVELWSTTFDSDMSAEIANPERLSIGTLDFSFVIIYLLPILIIILVFNVGGLEKDLGFFKLIRMQNSSIYKWLVSRYLYYYLIILLVIVGITVPYAFASGAIPKQINLFLSLIAMVMLYTLVWFAMFYFISIKSKGSAGQSIKMVALWLTLCTLLPGLFHQLANFKYPTSYMVDFLDANREKSYEVYDLSSNAITKILHQIHPEIVHTEGAKDTVQTEQMMRTATSAIVSTLTKNAALQIENTNEKRNRFIQNTYWLNPISYFQNKLNAICDNDYYAYQNFRTQVQLYIDKKIKETLMDTWDKKEIGKEKYLKYLRNL